MKRDEGPQDKKSSKTLSLQETEIIQTLNNEMEVNEGVQALPKERQNATDV